MKKIYIAMIFLLLGIYLPLIGQNNQVADTAKLPEVTLPDLVVSASKMDLRIKEIPTPVTLISRKILERNQIQNLNQLGSLIPNFSMADYGSKLTSPVYIRGVGSRINAPSVGLYVDNVPYFDKATFSFDFIDIDHIEVLRGPQGVLFGRNSMGGLINITTLSPMNFQGDKLDISAASYGNYQINAGHYARKGDSFAYSLAASFQHHDGFFQNSYLGKNVDWLNSFGFRNRLIYNITKKWTAENIASMEQSRQGGYPYGVYSKTLNETSAVSYNQESTYKRLMVSDAFLLKYGNRNWEFNNTFAYQYFDDAQKIDQDFTSDSLYFAKQFQHQHLFSYEGSFRSRGDHRLTWVAGIFSFFQTFDNEVQVDVYKTKMWYEKNYDSENTGMAVFGQLTWKIASRILLSGGLRYDQESNTMGYTYRGNKGTTALIPVDTLYPNLHDHILLPKLTLTYRFLGGTLYTSFATGYKPGGFNSSFETPDELNFKHEYSDNYEAGIKTSMFHNLLFTDLAVFYSRLKNQQIYRTTPSGTGSYIDNSGLSENRGFEIAVQTSDIYGFELNAAYGYTNSEIIQYEQSASLNYNHKSTPYIPRHTLAVQLTKKIDFKENNLLDGLRFNLLLNQKGVTWWDLNNTYQESSYSLWDGKIMLVRENIRIDIWCKNILDTSYKAFLFEALGKTYAQAGKPRQVGLSLLLNFK